MSISKLIEKAKAVISGRHTEGPGKDATSTMPHPAPPKDTEHIRADTQTHLDLKLEKTRPQINFKKISPETRPEQNVKELDFTNKKHAEAYIKRGEKDYKNIVKDISEDPENTGVFLISGKQAFVDKKGNEGARAHEGHHKVAAKLEQKYGTEKSNNLYHNMLKVVPEDVFNLLHNALMTNKDYAKLASSQHKQHRFYYKQEMINLIRDLSVGGDRRESFRVAFSSNPNGFKEMDGKIKKAWGDIVNFAKNATEEHMK